MSETLRAKRPRTWRTWLFRSAMVLVTLIATGVVALWWRLSSEYAEGKGMLTAIVAELDETDPGWRWEEIEASRAPIPDAENSALAVKRVVDSLGGWKVSALERPNRQPLLRPGAALN